MIANKLMRALKAPTKIASALDWKKASGSILTLDIGNKILSMAIASHPSFGEEVQALEPLPTKLESREGNKRVLSREVTKKLQDIVKNYNVAGFVVNWPLQPEGRCGSPCGKTLHTLESLLEESNSTIMNQNRPFCLWNDHHYELALDDNWGRNKIYGQVPPSSKTLHLASEEQYAHETSNVTAMKIWNNFCARQWPELCRNEAGGQFPKFSELQELQSDPEMMMEFPENYESTESYMSVSV